MTAHESGAIFLFDLAAWAYYRAEAYDHAIDLASRGLADAERHGRFRGEMHLLLAQIYARLPSRFPDAGAAAVEHLSLARTEKSSEIESKIALDPYLAGFRDVAAPGPHADESDPGDELL